MSPQPKWTQPLVTIVIVLGGLLPVLIYLLALGQVPTRMPEEAIRVLNQAGSPALLVDVRSPADFAIRHVAGAQNWPLATILGWKSIDQPPAEWRGKTLFLMDEAGLDSAQAVKHLRDLQAGSVYAVRGGLQEWAKAGYRLANFHYSHFTGVNQPDYLVVEKLSLGEQLAQALAGFGIKPLYMLGSLIVIIVLLQRLPGDMAALRWGVLFFLVGETFCYVNFFAFRDDSYGSEYLHSFGMVVCFGFVLYALLEGIETRVFRLHLADKPCAAVGLCRTCSKIQPVTGHAPRTCRARRMYQLLIPMLMLLCAMPLLAHFDLNGYSGNVFGYPYYYARFWVYQVFIDRVLPLMALFCLAVALLPLWSKHPAPVPPWTQIFFCAGLGILCFSFLRLSLGAIYATNLVWLDFWEEATELIFIVSVGVVLWLFRQALFSVGTGTLKK